MHNMVPGEARNTVSQLRRGVLEYCVLALLRDGERYGVELVRDLAATEVLATSEGTLYPLLSRLRREHLVDTTWSPSASGPPRRYYTLTPDGRAALDAFLTEWGGFRDAVEGVLSAKKA